MFRCCVECCVVVTDEKVADAAGTKSPPPEVATEKPAPQVFALMRNGHEVLRGAMKDIKMVADEGDLETFVKMFADFHKWMQLHKTMEEGDGTDETPKGFFRTLDEKFDGVATKGGLFASHEELDGLETKLMQEIERTGGNPAAVTKLYDAFEKANLDHLKKEEDVMMPKVAQMKKDGVDLKQLMKEEVLATVVGSRDFQFFVEYAMRILEKHDDGMPRARVFAHALWAVSTPEEWTIWNEWVKASVTPELYKEMEPFFQR